MSRFRGITRRHKAMAKQNNNSLTYESLLYLGSGSYGSVYEIYGTNIALKEHRIFSHDDTLCTHWKHEYDTHLSIFSACNTLLSKWKSGIVKPYMFSYGSRDERNILVPQTNVKKAQSCFFTMERVPGLASSNMCFSRKLHSLLKPESKLRPTYIPPYLYLGSLQPLEGHITLDMLQDTSIVEFPNEAYTYCIANPEGIASQMMKYMMLAFLTIVEQGFIPRDIEFVFNGSCNNTYISILDFNEAKSIQERQKGRKDYNLEMDIAHVYIDLCGLRQSSTHNPQAPYDAPTPQWKFLCSVLISPYSFFDCVEFATHSGFHTFRLESVISEILAYVEINIFRTLFERMSHVFSMWTPTKSEFSHKYTDFDTKLQMYYICAIMETIKRRKLYVDSDELVKKTSYLDALTYLQSILDKSKPSIVESDMDWGLWDLSIRDTSKVDEPIQNAPSTFRKRRYTLRPNRSIRTPLVFHNP